MPEMAAFMKRAGEIAWPCATPSISSHTPSWILSAYCPPPSLVKSNCTLAVTPAAFSGTNAAGMARMTSAIVSAIVVLLNESGSSIA